MKNAIIKQIKANKDHLAKNFTPKQKPAYLDKALYLANWVKKDEYFPISYDYEIVHEFSCKPYKGELIAYVYTNVSKTSIENIYIEAGV